MSNQFRLQDFKNGVPVKTREGNTVKFVAILPEETPARLCVEVNGAMENYFMNGSYLGTSFEHDNDIVMASHFD